MIQRKVFATLGAGAIALLGASHALAHARLVQSVPAAQAAGPAPKEIALTFSEKLEPAFSGFDLSNGKAKTPVKVGLAKDGVTLVGAPAKPLAPGVYRLDWHAVSADGHRMTGGYSFTVK